MAGRPSQSSALNVWMNGERVGTWSVSPRDSHAFTYAEEWLANPRRRPISLSLPLSRETDPFRGELVEAYFDKLRGSQEAETDRRRFLMDRHYLIDGIQRRHWNETAKRNAMGPNFETAIEKVLAEVPVVLDKVVAELPSGFSAQVSATLLEGIAEQARRLAAMHA